MRACKTTGMLSVALVLAGCGESLTGPTLEGDVQISADIVVDPSDPQTKTYTFDDLDLACSFTPTTATLYEDLTFPVDHPFMVCGETDGGAARFLRSVVSSETIVTLPAPATAVSVRSRVFAPVSGTPTLNAYAADGTLVGSHAGGALNAWVTLSVDGAGTPIYRIGLSMPALFVDLDDVTITYASDGNGDGDGDGDGDGGDGGDADDPASKAECAGDGWATFGFRNHGQCVRFVETGQDSRSGLAPGRT